MKLPGMKKWDNLQGEELIVIQAGPFFDFIQPLAESEDDGQCVVVAAHVIRHLSPNFAIPMLTIVLPGLCGHFNCGESAVVVMN